MVLSWSIPFSPFVRIAQRGGSSAKYWGYFMVWPLKVNKKRLTPAGRFSMKATESRRGKMIPMKPHNENNIATTKGWWWWLWRVRAHGALPTV
jgi:hypothetical protein